MSDYSPDYARGLADGRADAAADLASTVTDPAQGAVNPNGILADIVTCWNNLKRDEGAFPPGDRRAVMSEQRLWHAIQAAKAWLSTLPSTGLPAPAPHAEVREALAHIDKRLVDLREANEIFKKASWDRSSDILRNDREIRWLIDFSTMLRLPSPQQDRGSALDTASFYGAECPSYPNCSGGCGLGCTHEVVGRGK